MVLPKKGQNTHCMKLQKYSFFQMQEWTKDIEVRLFDEKRQLIRVWDYIQFRLHDDFAQSLVKQVIGLHIYKSFTELTTFLSVSRLWHTCTIEEYIDIMHWFYSKQDEEKYWVIGIEITSI